jgi:hypothetical protein
MQGCRWHSGMQPINMVAALEHWPYEVHLAYLQYRYVRLTSTRAGNCNFCLPAATVPLLHLLQQAKQKRRQSAFGGERRCKNTLPLSSKANSLSPQRQTTSAGADAFAFASLCWRSNIFHCRLSYCWRCKTANAHLILHCIVGLSLTRGHWWPRLEKEQINTRLSRVQSRVQDLIMHA